MRLYLFLIALLAAGCSGSPNSNGPNSAVNGNKNVNASTARSVPVSTYEVVKTYPHDSKAFTQGLVFRDGFLYESTGEYGDSTLRKVNLDTGKVLQEHELAEDYFAEGIAIMGDKVYQLSWRERTAWVYNLSDFKLLRELRYPGEGWGLANDASNLYLSDGTHVIRVLNPETFEQVRTIVVNDETGRPLMKLNELEFIKGEIWANRWHSEELGKPNHIARIDPATGELKGWVDLTNISPDDQRGEDRRENTLNGIAYDEAGDRIFVTGKKWKNLYEIKVKPKQ
ncbi:MAG TPA: glutaminyl-peptide cyclotransferase [Pyrinomonadaceae bacterium]|nr:glutaminyl-peptide cyclotransferase [Pyrinomonadaceae bacterium]